MTILNVYHELNIDNVKIKSTKLIKYLDLKV